METVSLNNRDFYKKMLRIALPIAVQSLIACSLSLVDNLMVGYLGELELAAVGIGVQIYFIHWMVLFGFNSGTATFMAQFWGSKDLKNIRKTVGFGVAISFAAGIVFFAAAMLFPRHIIGLFTEEQAVIELAVKYVRTAAPCFLLLGITEPFVIALRATQQTRIPLYISVVVFTTNTFLNYVFIFGAFGMPRLETTGAAVGTLVARSVEMLLILYAVFGRKNKIAGSLREFTGISRELAGRVIKNSLPTTLNETLWGLGQSAYMAAIGHIGVTAYAAAQASNTIENLFIMAGFSIGDAALILIGEQLGENNIAKSKAMAKKLLRIALLFGAVFGILLIICSGLLVGLFGFTPTGAFYARRILLIYGIFMILNLYNGTLITGVLRGGGDTRFAAISEVSCVWLIAVPAAFLGAMVFRLPVYVVVLLVKSENLFKAAILTYRYKSGKWAKNVIHGIK